MGFILPKPPPSGKVENGKCSNRSAAVGDVRAMARGDGEWRVAWVAWVAERRVRFPAVEALAQAHVAPCVTGVRQSADCLRPLPLRRPCAFASASPFVSGNRPHFHGDWSRPSVPRARPGHRRACAFRRLASPRARPARPLLGSAQLQSQGICATMARRNFILGGKNQS